MPRATDRKPVKGSEREPIAGARLLGTTDPQLQTEVTVYVRPSLANRAGSKSLRAKTDTDSLEKREYVSREALAAASGADTGDIAKIEAFAHDHHLSIGEVSLARRSIVLAGSVADLSSAFGVTLNQYATQDGQQYRGRTGAVHVPAEIAEIVEGVFGLDDRPQARAHFQFRDGGPATGGPEAMRATAVSQAHLPNEVAKLYNFPAANGSGQCVAIIELGGGYRTSDLKTYFKNHNLMLPVISAVSVDGARNKPGSNADGEVMLDIEVVGAIASKARIVVYFAPNTDRGFLDAITTAAHDVRNKPTVISISWGGPENSWTAQAMQQYDRAFQDAAALGVTVCCASGDNGSSDGVSDGSAHTDFPASSPNVLACGGTRLLGSGTAISQETVWNDDPKQSATGGGVSDQFRLPAYQAKAQVPPSVNPGKHIGRGVPDISGDADPQTGYIIRVNGTESVIGGTSAVAPLWAALTALLNQKLGKPLGFLNPLLYGSVAAAGALRDITAGDNGQYKAGKGWDACTGLGSPNGVAILAALSGSKKV